MSSPSKINEEELDEIYAFAIQLGKDAGKLLMDAARSRFGSGGSMTSQEITEKDNSVDIVTKADEGKVEEFIKVSITQRYPHHAFIGEETYSKLPTRTYLIDPSIPTWCVDPLDGTVNYTHLFPMFCVSIALVLGGEPIIGVIYAPFLNQLFTACRGRGAWLNETLQLPLVRNPIPPMPSNAPQGRAFHNGDRKRGSGENGSGGLETGEGIKLHATGGLNLEVGEEVG
ncbi:uncharacterized protein CTHT_0048000 [Thermochaetoides thermophila DSM 1495]|uniref:Inositol-phosphate phosphatase n=1 Tax=Chaetomium thermophilum (strain DSM 1495 / CBS 144.50 / IMI 039719) TaxID=759272 RepID=G0SAW2_CHATD|nr:hypothetical protein CTHT_0048000 [Thermochaetoides thermophila DSM 1495]EGS19342.1 hypothetical protein CTHT_0048000 [Thermochaetoides thermophila DSM 1495]